MARGGPEARFRARVRRDLNGIAAVWPIFFETITQTTKHGTPDFLLCIGGMFIGLELKAETGRTSRIQEIKLSAIANAGGMAIVAKPSNWEECKEVFRELARKAIKNDSDDVLSSPGTELPPGGGGDLV